MRVLIGSFAKIAAFIAILFSLFQLYTASFGILVYIQQRAIHMLFAFVLAFLLYPMRRKSPTGRPTVFDLTLFFLSLLTFGYLMWNAEQIMVRHALVTPMDIYDIVFSVLSILIVLEAARRVVGAPLAIVAVCALAYAYFGPYLPGVLGHTGWTLKQIIEYQFLTSEGIWGTPIGVSATYVFVFVLLGAFLEKSGTGGFFLNFANSLAGSTTGGPAKVSVVSSALFGTMSGSSVANVYGTGMVTIPLMKKTGYRPEFAGAVEAAASCGGQIMPPIMGAGAFLMAEFLEVPYVTVMIAAVLPAILYFLAIGFMVHFEALNTGLKGIPRSQLPKLRDILTKSGHLTIPLIILVYVLISGYSAMRAAFYAILAVIVVSAVRKSTRMGFRDILAALELGAKNAIMIVVACACAGIIVGVFTLTGLWLTFTSIVYSFSGGNLIFALLLVMAACIILGTGMPTTSAYILAAALGVPVLIELGVEPLAAHMFVFYFAVAANFTPPVALAAYAGANIAESDPMRTGFIAFRLGLAAFLVPYAFVFSPSLLLQGSSLDVVRVFCTATLGVLSLAAGVQGYLLRKTNVAERILLLISAVALIDPAWQTDLVGLILLTSLVLVQWKGRSLKNLVRRRSFTAREPK